MSPFRPRFSEGKGIAVRAVLGVRPDWRGLPKVPDRRYRVILRLLFCLALNSSNLASLDAQSRPDNPASPVVMVGTENREDDLPSLAAAPDGSLWLAWLAYSDGRDDIALRHRRRWDLGQPAIRPQHQR